MDAWEAGHRISWLAPLLLAELSALVPGEECRDASWTQVTRPKALIARAHHRVGENDPAMVRVALHIAKQEGAAS